MAKREIEVPNGEHCEECPFIKHCGSYSACSVDGEILTKLKGGLIQKSPDCPRS